MKIFISKKIRFCFALCICFSIMMFMTAGCTKESDKKEQNKQRQNKQEQSSAIQEETKMEGKTCFVPYSQSISLKNNNFKFLFFCDKTDKERWDRLNIQAVYLEIADSQQRMIIEEIQIEEEMVYGNYYSGILALKGNLMSISSGEKCRFL